MNTHRLWYRQPAGQLGSGEPAELPVSELGFDGQPSVWETQTLPIGNGFMGGMVYGTVPTERIQFNEKTLWSGGPGSVEGYHFGNRPGAAEYLAKIRGLLLEGDKAAAMRLADEHLAGEQNGFGCYQNFGELLLHFPDHEGFTDYMRYLDLDAALSSVSYRAKGVMMVREAFCSYPDRVMAVRIAAKTPGTFTVEAELSPGQPDANVEVAGGVIVLTGRVPDNGLQYEAQLAVACHDGVLSKTERRIKIQNACEVVLLLSLGTNYANVYPHYRGGHPHKEISDRITNAAALGWQKLLQHHKEDHRELYRRAKLTLAEDSFPDCPTDELLRCYRKAPVHSLEALLFHYGRYLLIASSRPGTLPANLQGVWNESNEPAWCGDYHFNINIQMNYWLAEVTSLTECSDSLVDYVQSLEKPGRVTAKEHFGANRGWAVNTMNNPFGFTAPGWRYSWGWAPNSNAFILMNLWEKYLFNKKAEDLQKIYPLLKGAALFWLDFLSEDKDGTLVSSPSFSPEHGDCEIGCAMDQQLVYILFSATAEAARLLYIDEDLQDELDSAHKKLSPPLRIGRWGQLQEWKEDIDDIKDTHRHVSHLAALYPGCLIHSGTPDFMKAARVTLLGRGDESTGWSRAWKLCLWARLKDGDHAYTLLQGQLKTCTYTNLLGTHPPFQIDGNFGYVAGVCELLLQSHRDVIELLPALPSSWPDGSFRGFMARGGFRVDANWAQGRLVSTVIYSTCGSNCAIKLDTEGGRTFRILDGKGNAVSVSMADDSVYRFSTVAGQHYIIEIVENKV
jgi:alpha-L-fucosidase 2